MKDILTTSTKKTIIIFLMTHVACTRSNRFAMLSKSSKSPKQVKQEAYSLNSNKPSRRNFDNINNHITTISKDILYKIIDFINSRDALELALVNKSFEELINLRHRAFISFSSFLLFELILCLRSCTTPGPKDTRRFCAGTANGKDE